MFPEGQMHMNEQYVTVGSWRIHTFCAGERGSAVVLLHGGGVDSARLSWELLIPALAREHRVFAPDLPGYGESDHPQMDYTTESYIAFLERFLDALGLQRGSLAGISMGGAIALGFTLAHPERVEKLALLDSYGLQRAAAYHKLSYLFVRAPGVNALSWALMRNRPAIRYTLGALLKRPGAITPALVELAYREATRPGANRAWTAFQNSEMTWNGTRTCYLDRLGEIHTPTLILHGTKDSAVPPECARQAAARIPGARLEWIEGAGHWPQRDDPAGVERVLTAFLRDG